MSRSGITITSARLIKFNRVDASKISFYLSIPALMSASFLGLKEVFNKNLDFNLVILISFILSFIFSYITIKYFLRCPINQHQATANATAQALSEPPDPYMGGKWRRQAATGPNPGIPGYWQLGGDGRRRDYSFAKS